MRNTSMTRGASITAPLKRKLASGQTVTMIHMRYFAGALVERLGDLGFDVVFIDCEKGGASVHQIEDLCRAGRAANVPTIVRPWLNDAGLISRYLDLGADGVMVAEINDAQQARQLVEAVRYARHQDHADKIVIGMIETPEAVANLASMLAVDGIDVWFVGPHDLAQHMGHPGKPAHAEVREAVEATLRNISAAGKVAGTVVDQNNLDVMLQAGARFLLVRIDELLADGANAYKKRLAVQAQ